MGVRYRRYLGWYILMTWEEGGRMIKKTAKRNKEVTTHLCAHRPRENGRETRVLEQEPRQAGDGNVSEYVRLRRVCR